jgi:hypothetical protein
MPAVLVAARELRPAFLAQMFPSQSAANSRIRHCPLK